MTEWMKPAHWSIHSFNCLNWMVRSYPVEKKILLEKKSLTEPGRYPIIIWHLWMLVVGAAPQPPRPRKVAMLREPRSLGHPGLEAARPGGRKSDFRFWSIQNVTTLNFCVSLITLDTPPCCHRTFSATWIVVGKRSNPVREFRDS